MQVERELSVVWREIQRVRPPSNVYDLQEITLMADIILVRMVADPTKAVEKQHGYRNALHGVYKMVQQEGPSSLARGLLPNTVRPPSPAPLITDSGSINERIPTRILRFLQRISPLLRTRERHATTYLIIRTFWNGSNDNLCACGRGQE